MRLQQGVFALCVAGFLALPLYSQNFGAIAGTVTDPTGAVVDSAGVTITNLSTNQTRRVTTNETGNYTMPFLVPGPYSVKVEVTGFKSAERRDLDLQVGAAERVDFKLELGEVTQNVQVTGAAPLLATESTALGTVIENRRVVELPLNGRNYLQLVMLSPNVTAEMGASGEAASRVGGERSRQAISVAGQRQELNYYSLDGISNTDVAYNLFIVRPSVDALEEFKVQTGVFSTEFGRATSQVSVATKSGANQFHGTVFEFLRNDKFDAKEWKVAGAKNPFRRNQFGFTLGGRLIRDKLFFMSNFESQKDRLTTEGRANVATDKMRSGDFSGQSRVIYDPASRVFSTDAQGNIKAVSATPFTGNRIPTERFNQSALKLLAFYPQATKPGDNILNNYIRSVPAPTAWEQFTQRIDWNQNANSNWFGRYSWNDEYVNQRSTFPLQAGRIQTNTHQAMLSNTRLLSSTVVNDARFGFSQFNNNNVSNSSGKRDVPAELGIVGLGPTVPIGWGIPVVSFQELTGFGDTNSVPTVMHNGIFQLVDNVSIIRGAHALKFGAEIRRDRFNQLGDAYLSGGFTFLQNATANPASRSTTGYSFVDFLLGYAGTSQVSARPGQAQLRSTFLGFYVEDTWKVTRRLTMNIGLRYENWRPWHDKYRSMLNLQMFDPGVIGGVLVAGTKTPIFTRPGSGDFFEGLPFHFHDGIPTQAGDEYLGRSLVRPDNNDFAPRLGLSYSPTERWSLRAGFGVFYAMDSSEPRYDMARNLGGRRVFTNGQENPVLNLSAPWASEAWPCKNWSGPCIGPSFTLANNSERRTPYIFQWLFNVQRQLTRDTSLEVGYQGNAGHKLERLRMYNEAVFRTGPNDSRSAVQRRPWPNTYAEIQMVDGYVHSNYNAASVKFQRRFAAGLTYLAGFTWSKAIDNGSAIRNAGGDLQQPIDNYNLAHERGLSQFHAGRRFVTSVLYQIPAGPGRLVGRQMGPAAKIVEGWQLGTILTFSDGNPVNIGGIGDPASLGLNNTASNFPDATGISPIPPDRSDSNFYNRLAFNATNPELAYRHGTTGRNVLFSPGVRQWDFSLLKSTKIRESHTLEFRCEAFNFPNHPNWNAPARDVRNANTWGRVTSAKTMRQIQLSLRYAF